MVNVFRVLALLFQPKKLYSVKWDGKKFIYDDKNFEVKYVYGVPGFAERDQGNSFIAGSLPEIRNGTSNIQYHYTNLLGT
jgi:hypothetical protein